jgi:hypothetical protein
VAANEHFLITGAGRCGTHWWQAALDDHLGVPTGHEAVFAPWGRNPDPQRPKRRRRWGPFTGDCSWPAVAYLEHAVERSTRVVHVVRDPLAMVRSRYGDNKLGDAYTPGVVRDCAFRHRPDVRDDAVGDAGRAILFVARWNRWCDDQLDRLGFEHRRLRIEDLSSDPDLFADTVGFLTGTPIDGPTARRTLDALDDEVGRHAPAALDWSDIALHPNGHELLSLALDYGYPVPPDA